MNLKNYIKEYLLITIGVLLVSIGVYFFKFPNNFSTGGLSGIAVITRFMFPIISASSVISILNVLLLIIALIIFGRKVVMKTIYGSIFFSLSLSLLEIIIPITEPLTSEPLLELIFAVLLPAFGSAILFNIDASTGGTDIIAMILKKYTSLDIGKSLLITDFLITSFTFMISIEVGLFSILGLLVKCLLVDNVVESINLCKQFMIVTIHPEPIIDYIVHELHRGTTKYPGKGGYTGLDKEILITIVKRNEALRLKKHVYEIDPSAFVSITNTSEIIGKGFRGQL